MHMENATKAIRIDAQVRVALVERMKPQESFNAVLRRILKVK